MGAMTSSPAGKAPDWDVDSHHRFGHVDEPQPQPCQDPAADHDGDADDMDPKERAYHERFMREAINMVNILLVASLFALEL